MDRRFLHVTRTGSNQWRSPRREITIKNTQSLTNLDGFRFEADMCLSWTFSVTQGNGHSGFMAEDQLG